MTANDVHKIVQALPKEEQASLYKLIGEDLEINTEYKKLKPKPKVINRQEIRNRLLETVFNVRPNKL
jgi:hypothetical protein